MLMGKLESRLYHSALFGRAVGAIPGAASLAAWRYRQLFVHAGQCNLFRGIYSSFEEARRNLPATKPSGYDHGAPAEMYRDRLDHVFPADYPVLFWLGTLLGHVRRVFDFGGHIGVARYAYARYLSFREDLLWEVCDVPAVVAAGRDVAVARGVKGLTFTTDPGSAGYADLFFSSGALQYMEWFLPEFLAGLPRQPENVVLNLLPLSDTETYFTIQNIGTAFCPYRIQQREGFFAGMAKLGYVLVDHWQNAEKACCIPFHPKHSLHHYEGAYFSRSSALA